VKCAVGIDLGSTTTKAVLVDERGEVVGQGITNSRSNYEVACAVARREALASARLALLERELRTAVEGEVAKQVTANLAEGFRFEAYAEQLLDLDAGLHDCLEQVVPESLRAALRPALDDVLAAMRHDAGSLFGPTASRKSDFFRDLAGAAFMHAAERVCAGGTVPFERLAGLFDRAVLDVETRTSSQPFEALLRRAMTRIDGLNGDASRTADIVFAAAERAAVEEVAFVGTGYGRQTLPFPPECIRSEILCHGRGAHAVFPGTRTVLDIGGQDTKAIQVDEGGVVTSFQMNDRCAAGCGRYLGYIADELGLGLHELGPLALRAHRVVRVNSTCTVFAGAELRERLALGQRREDILAGLHRAMMLRAMSLLARSGGVRDQFTFTGGVCKNQMATTVLSELVASNYGGATTLNIHPDSIYMGARGAALFALDDYRAGRGGAPAWTRH
jgi:benzoyl-CoA reductase subunit A